MPLLFHTLVNSLNGSAFGLGIYSINLNIPSVSNVFVCLNLPSWAFIFKRTIFSYNWLPSLLSLIFKSAQYLLGILLSDKALITSTTLKYILLSPYPIHF